MNYFRSFFLLSILFIFSCSQSAENKTDENEAPVAPVVDEKVYQTVEEMPRFPGCEQLKGDARKGCSGTQMFKYIKENLKYPQEAKDKGEEGRAVIGFVVDQKGNITDVKIKQDPGFGMGEEAKRVVAAFPTWIAGKNKGKNVKVKFNLPVKFELEE